MKASQLNKRLITNSDRSVAGKVQDNYSILTSLHPRHGLTRRYCHTCSHQVRCILRWSHCQHHHDRPWYRRFEGMYCAAVWRTKYRSRGTIDNSKDWRGGDRGRKTHNGSYLSMVCRWNISPSLAERMLTPLQVLLGGQYRLSVCSHNGPCGESRLILACLSYPAHVRRNTLDRPSKAETDSIAASSS